MKIKIVLLLAVILFFQSPVYAEAATVKQKVVGKTIKIVARIAVATTNIEKTKKRLVNKLRLMGDKQFRTQYAKFYELIKDMPQDIKIIYKVTPAMTREQMIENIESVDKKKIYKIINSIPDKTVAELFKEYRREYHGRPNNKIQ
jgi:hypothetical protein